MEEKHGNHMEVYLRTWEAKAFVAWRSGCSPLAPITLEREVSVS